MIYYIQAYKFLVGLVWSDLYLTSETTYKGLLILSLKVYQNVYYFFKKKIYAQKVSYRRLEIVIAI